MTGPLSGFKIVELAIWVAGPSTTAVLGDWGADVIKLEDPRGGDPMRGMTVQPLDFPDLKMRPPFELDNRNKRSLAINLQHPDGRDVAHRLLQQADVFVTNLRLDALERLGLDYTTLSALNSRLVYATLNGYGHTGPERLRGAFDYAAGWARTGLMATIAEPGQNPPGQRPGMIDHAAGLALAGAISAALLAREKTGQGQEVRLSLFEMGLWMNAIDLTIGLLAGTPPRPERREDRANPLWNCYRCADDKWIYLVMIQSDRHWRDFCSALEHPEWLNDPKFSDSVARSKSRHELTAMIEAAIATRKRADWAAVFDKFELFWAPVQENSEVLEDPQALALDSFARLEHQTFKNFRVVRSPVRFAAKEVGPRTPAPELGQHTEEVVQELGLDWSEIAQLKESGALG